MSHDKAERRARFQTSSGIPLEPCYGEGLGRPGEHPFLRGIRPGMYRTRFWTMRQYSGFGSARETNKRFRYLLQAGQTGLSVAFDLPTQMGFQSDHPLAVPEVGKVGVAINTLDDMDRLFDQIPLDQVTTSMTINATAAILLAMYVALTKRRGIPLTKLGGTVQNDILKEYAARGTYRFPVEGSLRLTTDLFAWANQHVPDWNPISVSGYHMREAGATAVQEVAFTLANGIAYLDASKARGLDVATVARRMSFFFNAHNQFFEEVAKFRAARRLWARLIQERFQVADSQAQMLRFHTQTAGSTLTSQQPLNNVVRVTLQALAAVLGGTQSLHTNSMDEALGLPGEQAAMVALRTQQILAHESGVADVIDPLGGSPLIESLTDALETGARDYLARIDRLGGAVRAIEQGFYQAEIHKAAVSHQRAVESGDEVVVGVNKFQVEEPPPRVFRVDHRTRDEVLADLAATKARRDAGAAQQALAALGRAAATRDNLVPHILACVEALASIGEICEALEQVFGRFEPQGDGM